VGHGDLGPADLAGTGLAAELAYGLDDQEHAVLAGMGVREAAAVGVHRQEAPGARAPVLDELTALALGAEAEVLHVEESRDREAVVAHQHVDVARLDSRLVERVGP
jgi:hypothetical protein